MNLVWPRDLRDVVDLMTAPEEGEWRVLLEGTAIVDGVSFAHSS